MIQDFFAQGRQGRVLVNNIRALRMLEQAGFITLHAQTGKKVTWYGQKTTAWYINDYTQSSVFEFRGRKFTVEYASGSFFPYVYEILKSN
jgi:DNA-binding transcriptional regulator YhcF (GntR family)